MRFATFAAVAIAAPAVAHAQQAPVAPGSPSIQVTGYGLVSTPPDSADLQYWVTGEGKTSDAATAALAAKQKAIVSQVGAYLGGRTQVTAGNVVVIESRGPNCKANNGYGAQPMLSEGDCAVTGYIATLQGAIRTGAVRKAGSAAAFVSHLGARDARLQGFALSDEREAQRRAMADAIADARNRAEVLAAASGARLGAAQSIRDSNGPSDTIPPLPAPPVPQRVPDGGYQPADIEVTPKPIETRTQVFVTYALER